MIDHTLRETFKAIIAKRRIAKEKDLTSEAASECEHIGSACKNEFIVQNAVDESEIRQAD
jgi:hypothetical protein